MKAPVITIAALVEAGHMTDKNQVVKVLATGRLMKALKLEGVRVSAGAKAKIEKAGGNVK
jgi:large subunit ribosomal protein L15